MGVGTAGLAQPAWCGPQPGLATLRGPQAQGSNALSPSPYSKSLPAPVLISHTCLGGRRVSERRRSLRSRNWGAGKKVVGLGLS